MAEGKIMQIPIVKHETLIGDDKKIRVCVWDDQKRKYTHFVNEEKDGDWSEHLKQDGKMVTVFMIEKPNPINDKFPYRNIYKPKEEAKATADSSPLKEPDYLKEKPPEIEHIPANKWDEKDIKIRWMNALNNAVQIVLGLDLKKLGQPEIFNYILTYANFFNTVEAGMIYETIPIFKSQVIRLHEIVEHYRLDKQTYHEVLGKILDKTVAKTTDLTYQDAVKCIQEFDETMGKIEVPEVPEQETIYDQEPLPF